MSTIIRAIRVSPAPSGFVIRKAAARATSPTTAPGAQTMIVFNSPPVRAAHIFGAHMTAEHREAPRHRHGNLRHALLAAARRLLEAEGHSNLSLRKCAEAAGVSATAPQNHFPDKAARLTALAALDYAELEECMRQGIDDAADRDARRKAALTG